MKPLRWVLIATIAVLVLGYIAGYFMPGEWSASAQREIAAPPQAIHAWLEDPAKLAQWSPWRDKDPDVVFKTSGAPRGAGAVLRWESEKVGFATLSITRSDPARGIEYDLAFDGVDLQSHGAIELEPKGASTLVTWRDGGKVVDSSIPKLFRALREAQLAQEFAHGLRALESKVLAR